MKDDYIDWELHFLRFFFSPSPTVSLEIRQNYKFLCKVVWEYNKNGMVLNQVSLFNYLWKSVPSFFLSFSHSFDSSILISIGVQWMIDREQSTFFPLDLSIAWGSCRHPKRRMEFSMKLNKNHRKFMRKCFRFAVRCECWAPFPLIETDKIRIKNLLNRINIRAFTIIRRNVRHEPITTKSLNMLNNKFKGLNCGIWNNHRLFDWIQRQHKFSVIYRLLLY